MSAPEPTCAAPASTSGAPRRSTWRSSTAAARSTSRPTASCSAATRSVSGSCRPRSGSSASIAAVTIAMPRLVRVPPLERGITLGDFLVPIRVGELLSSRLRHVLMVAIGAALIVLGARISFYLPGNPFVPVTLQTFGVLFGGALLGARRGVLAVLLYLLLGVVGLPIFAWSERIGD